MIVFGEIVQIKCGIGGMADTYGLGPYAERRARSSRVSRTTYLVRKELLMNIDTVLQILDTRRAVARENGNTTELSLLYELTKIAEEYKVMKEVQIQR